MKRIVLLIIFSCSLLVFGQEKQLWAKSFLNEKAPEIVVEKWLNGPPDTEGKFILIDFWATWCGPCVKVIPELNSFQEKFKDKLVVIGISDETQEKVEKLKKPSIQYYSAIDTQKRLATIYEVKGIPHCVIINPEGIVVWEGFPALQGYELTEKTIEDLLKENEK